MNLRSIPGAFQFTRRQFALALGLFIVAAVFTGLKIAVPPALSTFYSQSSAVYARRGELLRLSLAADQQYRLWVPLAQIPPSLQNATLLYEDQNFYRHPGINPVALVRGAVRTYLQGYRQGGSTLTMQLARQRYHLRSRHLLGKLQQILAAFWLELNYSKSELLEAYLNTAPYGGNISGVEAASLIYFHKPATQLTLAEALALAVIPQNPRQRAPGKNANTPLLTARQALWQRWQLKYPGATRYAPDFNLPPSFFGVRNKPFLAPHLTTRLLKNYPGQHSIVSSIDLPVQNAIKSMIDSYVTQNARSGIQNVSALLVDTQYMQVRALIGSADFWNGKLAGQVDGTAAKRSPGSTLKPFIYALALDQGLIHPRTLLADTPSAFGAFNPENFDGRFLGPLSAQDALIRSRNIPAMNLAAKLTRPDLYGFLQQAGIAGLAEAGHYGLALALGGAELSMAELVQLYAMLANAGKLQALQFRADLNEVSGSTTLVSPAASYITLNMLSFNLRPDSRRPALPEVAWKTGTSWGFKDAWTIGVAGHYVLAVWVGNFKNTGSNAFIGIQSAAPLFFNIIDGLRATRLLPGLSDPITPQKPETVAPVKVCVTSGDFPNEDCPSLVKTWFIPGVSPIKTSTLHKAVYFDQVTGEVVCPDAPHSRKEIYEFWPAELARLFTEAGLPRRSPPPLPDCYGGDSNRPTILSPSFNAHYRLKTGDAIALKADAAAKESDIFWFADKNFLGKANASTPLWWSPKRAGPYLLRAVDAGGHAASRQVRVEFSRE